MKQRTVMLLLLLSGFLVPFPIIAGVTALEHESCSSWPKFAYEALEKSLVCGAPPMESQIGSLCVRHEWRCNSTAVNHWLISFLGEARASVDLGIVGHQLVLIDRAQDGALAVFLDLNDLTTPGFSMLISRLSPAYLERTAK